MTVDAAWPVTESWRHKTAGELSHFSRHFRVSLAKGAYRTGVALWTRGPVWNRFFFWGLVLRQKPSRICLDAHLEQSLSHPCWMDMFAVRRSEGEEVMLSK